MAAALAAIPEDTPPRLDVLFWGGRSAHFALALFYGSIKLANASVAATSIALAPIFLSIVEPLLSRQSFVSTESLCWRHPVWHARRLCALHAVGSAGGDFSILNKRLAMRVPALSLAAIDMGAGALLLGFLIPIWPALGATFNWPGQADLSWLLMLALPCTLLPFALASSARSARSWR